MVTIVSIVSIATIAFIKKASPQLMSSWGDASFCLVRKAYFTITKPPWSAIVTVKEPAFFTFA